MAVRPLNVLYVEDDPLQQRLVEHALRAVPEFACKVTFAASEEDGVSAFNRSPADVVLVDYQLTQGDGLELVRRVREADRLVPIIAVSGVAPDEVAERLVLTGADDFLDKRTLDSKALGRSLRAVLVRADGVRRRTPSPPASTPRDLPAAPRDGTPLADGFKELARLLTAAGPDALIAALDRCERAAHRVGGVGPPLVDALDAAQLEAGRETALGVDAALRLLRPFALDVADRVSRSPRNGGASG